MGGGSWTEKAFTSYSTTRGLSYDASTRSIDTSGLTVQDMYKSYKLNAALDPKDKMRECCDSEEHPNTVPVILALDVTGSMGRTAMEVASKLNLIMTDLYGKVQDVEFMIMGIGDFYCDDAPLQVSQFESDIRIAEQLDKVYFEAGGGGNGYESYTGAWAFAAEHTSLDCWKRGKKGILITLGDEPLNPYIDKEAWESYVGKTNSTLDTAELYDAVTAKYDVYHIHISDSSYRTEQVQDSWIRVLGQDHFKAARVRDLAEVLTSIITAHANAEPTITVGIDLAQGAQFDSDGAIVW